MTCAFTIVAQGDLLPFVYLNSYKAPARWVFREYHLRSN